MALDDGTDWTEENVASCISVIEGVTPTDAVAGLFPAGPVRFESRDEAERWAYFDAESDEARGWIAVGEIAGRTFVWEENGYTGSLEDAAAKLSANGRFASMFWNVNGLMSFVYAEYGEVEIQFDPLEAPADDDWKKLVEYGATKASDDDWEEAPEFNALIVQAALLGLERPADPSWLDGDDVEFWGTTL